VNVDCEGVVCGDNDVQVILDAVSCGCVQKCCVTASASNFGLMAAFGIMLMGL